MKSDNITEYQYLLLNMLSNALFDQKADYFLNKDNISKVYSEAYIQTVELIAFSKISLDSFEPAVALPLRNKVNIRFIRNITVNNAHIRLHSLLQHENIPYVILKGMAAAYYYPDAMLRAMGDVDFLVKPEDIERVDKLFLSLGYKSSKKENDHHITYEGSDARYELHFCPPGIPEGTAGERIEEMLSDIIEKRVVCTTELGNIYVPSKVHHGLILLLHTVHHLTGDGLGLRHLCDWAVFQNSFNKEDFCSLFEGRLKSVGLWQFTLVLSDVCARYLGCSVVLPSSEVISSLSDKFIEDIFSSGNFGQKNEDRSHESLLISSPAEKNDEKHSTMILQAVRSVNEIVFRNWPLVRRFNVLLPIGWLFFGARYIFRSLIGKRPAIHLKSVFSEAQNRIEFYNKLIIFDIDEE